MTNAHYHRDGGTFLSHRGEERRFIGVHPWAAETEQAECVASRIRDAAIADATAGIGEIGLDRLRTRIATPAQHALFETQLRIAAELHRPVVLHGAKCWGEVVKAAKPFAKDIPAFLFHGFSRSAGLVPEIVAMNGFLSVGKAILNDHALNYRKLVAGLPLHRLLIETDDDATSDSERDALLAAIFAKTAELTGLTAESLDSNAAEFINSSSHT